MRSATQRRSLVIIWITIFIDLMGFTLIIPFINDYVAELGGDEQSAGLLLGAYAAMQLLFAPVWGRISDRIGRRPVIIIGLGTSAIAFTIFGLADQLWLLFASRMLAGIANANVATAQACVADFTPASERAGRMGLIGAAFNLGFIIGFPIGGILSNELGHQAPIFFAAGVSLLNCLAALFILPESYPREARSKDQQTLTTNPLIAVKTTFHNLALFWRRPALSRLLTTFLLYSCAFSTLHVIFVEYGRDVLLISPSSRGFIFMFMGIVGAVTQGTVVRRLARRMGEDRVIQLGLIATAIGLASIPFLRTVTLVYLGCFFTAVGNSLVNPSVMAVVSMRSQEQEQGVALGVTQSLSALGRIIGPPFGGLIYARISFYSPFLTAAAATLIALGIYATRPKAAE